MEELTRNTHKGESSLEAFPGCQIIVLDGVDAEYAADLSLHQQDLKFATQCIEQLNRPGVGNSVLRDALWHGSISYFVKCFLHGKRHRLDRDTIYARYGEQALRAFDVFFNLRSEHFAHDVNGLTAAHTCAVLTPTGSPHKVECIVTTHDIGDTLTPTFMEPLASLIECALVWVEINYDTVCNHLQRGLEALPYDELKARPSLDLEQIQSKMRTPSAFTKNSRLSRKGEPTYAWLSEQATEGK
jgi:hypothetical protein